MANQNPNPATRFKKGEKPPGNGRPKGSRDRISTAFLNALADDFETHGVVAIQDLRKEDVSSYVRVVASLQPKEIELKRPLDGMGDGELLQAIDALTTALRSQVPPPEVEEAPK